MSRGNNACSAIAEVIMSKSEVEEGEAKGQSLAKKIESCIIRAGKVMRVVVPRRTASVAISA
jgi:hypothetical protein